MKSKGSIETATCDAMREQGIEAANTKEGIEFCTELCPYDHCVIAETQYHGSTSRGIQNYWNVRNLAKTMPPDEIAKKLKLSRTTVFRWLRKMR